MSTSEIVNPKIDTTITDEPELSPKKEVGIMKPSSFNGGQRIYPRMQCISRHQREYIQDRQIESGIYTVTHE